MLTKRLLTIYIMLLGLIAWFPGPAQAEEKQPAVPAVFLMKTIEGEDISIPNKGQKQFSIFGRHGVRPAKRSFHSFNRFMMPIHPTV